MKADKDSMFSVVDPYLSLTSQNLSAQLIILRYENVDHRAVLALLAFQLFNDASQVASLLLLICDHRPKLFVHLPEKKKNNYKKSGSRFSPHPWFVNSLREKKTLFRLRSFNFIFSTVRFCCLKTPDIIPNFLLDTSELVLKYIIDKTYLPRQLFQPLPSLLVQQPP